MGVFWGAPWTSDKLPLNTTVSTVQKWEIGEKRRSGPSLKLLNVIQRKGIDAIS